MSLRSEDLRSALRALRKHPLETLSVLVILSLGIGATSAAFSLVDGVVLRPLPYPAPERLVGVQEVTPSGWQIPVSPGRWALWSGSQGLLDPLAAAVEQSFDLTGAGRPERLDGARVSEGFFALLGARAARGRLLAATDQRSGAERAAVLSHAAWQRRFGGDPDLVGREVELTGEPYTVVGVLDETFRPPDLLFDRPPEVWTALGPHLDANETGSHFLQVLGRLRPAAGAAAAAEALGALAPPEVEAFGIRVFPLHAETVGPVRTRLFLFLGAVGLLFLTACANVAGILLARGLRRQRDLAIRAALGADRRRIAALLGAEGALLAAGAAAGGLAVAVPGVELMRRLFGQRLPRIAEVAIDGRVLAFTVAVAALAVVLSALLPARRTARRALVSGLRRDVRERAALRRALLVAEIGLAMVLVVGAALLGRSLAALSNVDPGFDPADRLALELSVDPARYPQEAGRRDLFERVAARVRALPGVQDAALATTLPFGRGSAVVSFQPEGSAEPRFAALVGAGPGYFRAMGIPLVAGRAFRPADAAGSRRVAVVSAATARALWPGDSAVGRRIPVAAGDEVEVVGVVGDVRLQSLAREPDLTLYRPFADVPGSRAAVVARLDPAAGGRAAPDLRQAVWSVDAEQPVARVAPLAELVAESLHEPRGASTLFGAFAALAALLSALGLYGLMSELVTRGTREVGVRMALGAGRGRVVGLVMRRALALAAAGVLLGGLAAYAGGELLEGLLYEVRPTDPATYAAVAALLLAVAALASWVPARRAATTDPVAALKAE